MRKKISLVIVTYNSSFHIFDCLESVLKYNDIGEALEIIVVDNASPEQDDVFRKVREKFGDRIILINSGKNGGYGYGNNIGVEASTSDLIIVMNPDIRLVTPIFNNILGQFNANVGMMGIDFVDGSCPYYFKRGHTSVFRSLFTKLYIHRRKYDANEMFLSGSFLVFDKETFIKAGRFDDNIFMYSEEADITNRILLTNKQVIWCPQIKVLHLPHSKEYNLYLDKIRLKSGLYYEKKYSVDSKREYRITIKTLLIKRLICLLILNVEKFKYLSQTINTLREFAKQNNLV